MTTHTPIFLHVYEPGGSTAYSVQNFYHSTITQDGIAYQFLDFGVDKFTSAVTADANEITLTLPALTGAREMVGTGTGFYLAAITAYQFTAAVAPEAPPAGQAILAQFVGRLISWSIQGVSTLSVVVGSPLSPVAAQFPARRYDSTMVGIPCRL
jgi:hypothetical protein